MTPLVSPAARADLSDIWDRTEAHWGQTQAIACTRRLAATFDLLASDPRAGRRRDEIRAGYRRFEVGSHIVFHRQAGGAVEIVRVLHGRMHSSRHLR